MAAALTIDRDVEKVEHFTTAGASIGRCYPREVELSGQSFMSTATGESFSSSKHGGQSTAAAYSANCSGKALEMSHRPSFERSGASRRRRPGQQYAPLSLESSGDGNGDAKFDEGPPMLIIPNPGSQKSDLPSVET